MSDYFAIFPKVDYGDDLTGRQRAIGASVLALCVGIWALTYLV